MAGTTSRTRTVTNLICNHRTAALNAPPVSSVAAKAPVGIPCEQTQ
jgi:hypothetical protein